MLRHGDLNATQIGVERRGRHAGTVECPHHLGNAGTAILSNHVFTTGKGGVRQQLGQEFIARRRDVRRTELRGIDGAVEAAGAAHYEAVCVQLHLDLGTLCLRRVVAVHQRIDDELTQHFDGVFETLDTLSMVHDGGPGQVARYGGHGICGHFRDGPLERSVVEEPLAIGPWVAHDRPRNDHERDEKLGEVLLRVAAEHGQPGQRGVQLPLVDCSDAGVAQHVITSHASKGSWTAGPHALQIGIQQAAVEVVQDGFRHDCAIVAGLLAVLKQSVHLVVGQLVVAFPRSHIATAVLALGLDETRFLGQRTLRDIQADHLV